MAAPIVIIKILLNGIGFVVSFESLRNTFILGILIGIAAMILSMALPNTNNHSMKTTVQ
jgi:hypothetical protein